MSAALPPGDALATLVAGLTGLPKVCRCRAPSSAALLRFTFSPGTAVTMLWSTLPSEPTATLDISCKPAAVTLLPSALASGASRPPGARAIRIESAPGPFPVSAAARPATTAKNPTAHKPRRRRLATTPTSSSVDSDTPLALRREAFGGRPLSVSDPKPKSSPNTCAAGNAGSTTLPPPAGSSMISASSSSSSPLLSSTDACTCSKPAGSEPSISSSARQQSSSIRPGMPSARSTIPLRASAENSPSTEPPTSSTRIRMYSSDSSLSRGSIRQTCTSCFRTLRSEAAFMRSRSSGRPTRKT